MPRESSLSEFDGESLLSEEEVQTTSRSRPSPSPLRSSIIANRRHSYLSTRTRSSGSLASQSRRSVSSRGSDIIIPVPQIPIPQLPPKDRFRAIVRKIITIHRVSAAFLRGGPGAEPGVDPRRHSAFIAYGHVRQQCRIDIMDYSSVRCSVRRMTNAEFIDFLQNDNSPTLGQWVKVRWINIGGISWDVISALALKYEMHPLSVEDLLHPYGHTRSKADYYPKHLFIRILCHTLGSTSGSSQPSDTAGGFLSAWSSSAPITSLPRSSSPQHLDVASRAADEDLHENDHGDGAHSMSDESEIDKPPLIDPEMGGRKASLLARRRRRALAELTLEELKRGERVDVRIEPLCIFLFRDGTVISFNPKQSLDFTEPIAKRIRQEDSSLRTTADSSLLVENLLDLVVDSALEVVDEYHVRLSLLERRILIKSRVSTVRSLHILSGDLILHKRTLGPIKALIRSLRRYDVDRTAVCLDMSTAPGDPKIVGYMSHKAKTYLADVHEHIEYAMSSLDMYAAMTENLINYTFNMASYEMNEVMRRLTLCTIVFLPLTLLTGYFGMNFDHMWSVHHGHTDVIFWVIAIPVMSVVAPAFMWPDIVRAYNHITKGMLARDVKKRFKGD